MITSTSNQQIKNVIKLQKSAAQRRKQKRFIVEGIRMFREIPKELLVQVFVTEEFLQKNQDLFQELSYELVSSSVYKDMSDTMSPQGVLAVVRQLSYSLRRVVTGRELDEGLPNTENGQQEDSKPALLLLENLQDPGNLGTILRMAEGAGITGLILSKDTVDIYNSKVIRSTMGSIFRVPFIYVEDIMDAVRFVQEQEIITYAAHLCGNNLYESDFTRGSCIFIGNEGNGLTPELTALADEKIRIPMQGKVESLNAATAATVLSYEMLRQRKGNIS